MEEPLIEGGALDESYAWFIYIGEMKAAPLNGFLTEPLSRRYGKPARCIHVVPDVTAHYPPGDFVVVNPESDRLSDGRRRVNVRLPAGRFAEVVSADRRVEALVESVLRLQGEVIVNVFEARRELALARRRGVKILGPDPGLARRFNNKLRQHEMAAGLGLPVPPGVCCRDVAAALDAARQILDRSGKVFVSGPYSAAGSNSIITDSLSWIGERFGGLDGGLLVTEHIEHDLDPTVLGVVAGPDEVYIASVADQNIVGTRFTGSTFPTVLEPETARRLVDMTREVGRHMGREGYRGAFGCDFIVDSDGKPWFIEVNARKQGTTMETALTMELAIPGHPSFPELELAAVLEGRFPADLVEMEPGKGPLHWGTYNHKAEENVRVTGRVLSSMDERGLFSGAAQGRPGFVILDHVGPDTVVHAGGFVARAAAAAPERESMLAELERARAQITAGLGNETGGEGR